MKFGCPLGHVEGIQESFHCHVWIAVNPATGEADMEDSYGKEEFDNESFRSDGRYYCPTCNDTFDSMQPVEPLTPPRADSEV